MPPLSIPEVQLPNKTARYERRVRRATWLVTLALAIAACAPAETGDPSPEPDPILSSLQVYTTGNVVTFVLQVTNASAEPIELTFPTGQSYDFVVRRGNEEV